MLAAVAARLPKATDNVWIDLGGGTGVRPRATSIGTCMAGSFSDY
jgi:hypothetical protein